MSDLLKVLAAVALLTTVGCGTAVAPTTPSPVLSSIGIVSEWSNADPQHIRLTAIGKYSDESRQTLTNGVAWASSRPEVATVASDGTLTMVGEGVSTISAAYGDKSGTYDLRLPLVF